MPSDRLAALAAAGVSIWLDDLSRERLATGNLAGLIRDQHVVGVTTNPTIFAAALKHGEAYDQEIRELAVRGASVQDAVREITVSDVREACEIFRATWEATDGIDGRVSLEVDPGLAFDTDATVAEAVDLWKSVDRPNLLVKIPATEAGLPAITSALAQGISVNVTLIFSIERYRHVMDAFIAGIKQAAANGHNLGSIASVASFFVSRVDTEVDQRLEAIGAPEALELRGKAALANARLAYSAFQEVFADTEWRRLSAAGANPQRPLWASTGTKNPAYPDTYYVSELVVAGAVNTMPQQTLDAFADHGEVPGDTVAGRAEESQQVFDALAKVGVDIDDVFETLEREGVQKFLSSWEELGHTVEDQLSKAKG